LIRKKYIQKFFSFFLLAILVLGNTPTRFLHDIFADHTDFVSPVYSDSKSPQFNVTGINCHCDQIVVISPYTFQSGVIATGTKNLFKDFTISRPVAIVFSEGFNFQLRGPPAVA
jgi:hypothetical protein